MMSPAVWGMIGAAVSATLLAGQRVWEQRRGGPSAASQLTRAAADLITPLRAELTQLHDDIRKERAECAVRIDELQAQIVALQADNQALRDELAGVKAVIRMRKQERSE